MEKTFKKLIIGGAILSLIIFSFVVIWPILLSIISGLILAYIFSPVYKLIFKLFKEKNISSFIIVLLILFLIFIPLWFLFPIVTRQLFDAYTYIQKIDLSGILGKILPQTVSTDSIAMINSFISKLVNSIFSKSTDFFVNIPNLLLQALVILIVFFFALRDSDKLKEYVKGISPFSPSFEDSLVKQFKDITNSVIFGHIITGIVQGLFTGLGLWVFGVHQVLILTLLAMLAAVIPVLGAWLVWLPAAIYLFMQGSTGAGIGLFLYGAIFISWIDNFLRLYIISKRTTVSTVVIFVGMIGGLIIFGLIGLVIGPLILAYLIIVLDAYKNKKLIEFFSSE